MKPTLHRGPKDFVRAVDFPLVFGRSTQLLQKLLELSEPAVENFTVDQTVPPSVDDVGRRREARPRIFHLPFRLDGYEKSHEGRRVLDQDTPALESPLRQKRRRVIENHDVNRTQILQFGKKPQTSVVSCFRSQTIDPIDTDVQIGVGPSGSFRTGPEKQSKEDIVEGGKPLFELLLSVHDPLLASIQGRGQCAGEPTSN